MNWINAKRNIRLWILAIALYSGIAGANEVTNNGSSNRYDRATKTSSYFGGSSHTLCDTPAAPKNGGLSCNAYSRRMYCTATCLTGFRFSDGSEQKKHSCSNHDGAWLPESRFPDCEPVCDPPCQNGGQCYGQDRCVCTPTYRGDKCEYAVANCDGNQFHQTGNWACNHTNDQSMCTISCPPGMQFEYPPSNAYICDLEGNWLPKQAPKCISMNVAIHPIYPTVPATLEPLVVTKVIEKRKSVCTTWGQLHYRTFDGSMFSIHGKCTYLLMRDCASDSFSIHVKNDPQCNGAYNCSRSVIIYINNNEYTLEKTIKGPSVSWGMNRLKIPTTINGLLIEEVASYIIVQSGLGFTVRWNGQDVVLLEADVELFNKTCGLCGRFDGKDSNDFEMADGTTTTNIATLVNSWKMSNIGDSTCIDASKLEHTCRYDSPVNQRLSDRADEICGRLMLPEYSVCHMLLDPKPYFEMCRLDFCSCGADGEQCACSSLAAYFQEFHRLGGKLPQGWRKPDFCNMECRGDMVYQDCGSSCPKTCKKSLQECTNEQCVDGCHCPQGTVLHSHQCIDEHQCPCFYSGKTYTNGQSIQQDCNACICEGGAWQCTHEKCEARCSSVGDPHYTTFDGKRYDFMGKCSYYLMYSDNYTIEQENVACSGAISENMGFIVSPGADYPSCTKSVTIRLPETAVQLKQRREITVDGKDVTELPFLENGIHIYSTSSLFVKVELSNGLSIIWDGASRVYIDAPTAFLSNTKGLCGTYNYNQKDDFLTGEGDVEQSIGAFANKWKVSESCQDMALSDKLKDPCEVFSQRKDTAQLLCGKLKSEIFSACHDVIDPEPFFKDCMYDMCYCQTKLENCLCPAISDYAVECAKKGSPVEWRSNVRQCGLNCPGGQVYQVCGSSCKRSCTDISYHTKCREQCVEGCNCPPGMTLNAEGECIPISSCPCIHGNKNFIAGHKDFRGSLACECTNARWECRPATENELSSSRSEKLQEMPKCSAAANMEYTDCASDCPKTCKNMHQHTNCESSYCKPGCSCMKGYVLDTKTSHCVKPTQCPCHHGGQSYGETETIQEDCNTCVCEGGAWKCESKECPGICTAWGESHFKSYDGRMFEFHGDCDYILAKGGEDKSDKFLVTIHNVPCGSSDITCTKSVSFDIGDDKVTLASGKPLQKSKYSTRYLIREVGLYVFIHTDIGITLQWDKGTRVYVKADARWKNRLAGLCGNFNGDENDDFKTSDGGLPVAKSTVFGDSWRLRDYCPVSKQINNTCDLHPNRKSWAMRQCSILKSTLFRPCHSEVPYEPYLDRCVFDSCGCDMGGDCHCLCTALATYAQECNSQGVAIQWRSQELCPIQCETCAKYTSCMSVCPPKTCETQFLYTRIEDSCGQELCVEGCEPKPCPVGEIFNNDKEFKCIPIDSCGTKIQQCKFINGHMYNEGERINDPKVADICQSCFCRGGDIVCLGKKCTEVTQKPVTTLPTITTPITAESQITPCLDGWSEWINAFSPTFKNGGDYETFELFKKRQVTICPLENIQHIECRTAATHKHYKEAGQNVWCSLPEGLVCENKDQPSVKLCFDYEIRVYCECPPIIIPGGEAIPLTPAESTEETATEAAEIPPKTIECTAPGWTEWMNSKEPSTNGEYEILPDLRKQFTFCSKDEISEIECRPVAGKHRVIRQTISTEVECTKDRGLVCLNSDGKVCPDYEVRFYCRCSETDCAYPRGMETGSIDDQHVSVSSFKTPMSLGHKARLNGKAAWIAGKNDENQWIEIDLSEIQEITGLETQGNPNSNEWVSAYRITYSDDGRQWESIKNANDFDQIFAGNTDKTTAARNMFKTPINARFIRVLPIEWETGISLRLELLGCNRIVTAIPTTQPPTTQVETVSPTTPSPTPTTPTTRGTPFPYQCEKDGWTLWMNMDSPETNQHYEILTGNIGDVETIDELRYFYSFCANPVTVECRASHTKKLAHLTGQKVKCDLDGITCSNDKQTDGQCLDYEIRFYCECEEKTTTTPVAPTTGSTITQRIEPCTDNEWTEWMNSNNPKENQDGDMETYKSLRSKYSFCGNNFIVNIECRVVGTEISYSESSQYGVVCDLNNGLQCLHSMQSSAGGECKDYEVRFYCLCQEIVTGIFTPIATEETKPWERIEDHTASSRYETTELPNVICNAWTLWMNMDNPHDDGNDYELLRNIPNFDQMCPKPVSFQCRDAYSRENYHKTGQNLKERCNANGIVCESKGQKCRDYEIRIFCLCPTPPPEVTCQPSWTQWFDTDDPTIGEGDFEQIDDIRQKFDLCPTEFITDIQCQARSYSVGPKQLSRLQGKGGTSQYGSSKVGSGRPIGKTGGRIARQIKTPGKSENKFGGWVDYTETGDVGVKCSKTTGLACYNDFQKKKCRDYRVRFYCSCAKPTHKPWSTARTTKWIQETTIATSTTPQPTVPPVTPIPDVCGWTPWLNADDPEVNLGSDFETIEKLQDVYNLCEKAAIKDIECRIADSKIAWDKAGQNGLTCDTQNGFRCDNSIQHRGCYDYEVRVACIPEWCEGTTMVPPTEIIATVVTTPPCEPGQTWSDCAYRCDSICQSFLLQAINSDLCNVTTACLPGCISKYCEPPNIWRDEATCVKPEECTCMLEDGQILPPGEVFDMDDCEQCQCIANTLHCEERQGCRLEETTQRQQFNVTVTPYGATEISTDQEIIKPAVHPYIVQEDCWTEWINIDSPDNDKLGDREDLATIRTYYSFCDEPIAIECRKVDNDQQAQQSEKQDITCDVKSGLVCWNQKNWKASGCYDYEVRFFCPCASSTVPALTTEEVTTIEWSERTHEICTPGFTNWFNAHRPNDDGEYENIQSIRQAGYEFCDNNYITAMECRVKESGIPHHKSSDQGVTCDFLGGLYCENKNQQANRKCMDYEVRFFCDCGFIGFSTEPVTESTTTTEQPTTTTPAEIPITATAVPVLITTPLPCSYWSDWINNDKPWMGKGDVEYNQLTDFCKDGEVQDIQCILADSNIAYTESNGRGLICSVEQGFICKNNIQPGKMCNDYKIRYYCGCVTTTPTSMVTTTPSTVLTTGFITIIIVPAPPPPSTIPCEEYFYFINNEHAPLPDSQLQASSSLNAMSGPQSGRLQATTSPTTDGGWVPQHKNTDQYIQVDLMKSRAVYGVATQGHFVLQSWVTSYEVIFSKDGIAFSYAMSSELGSTKIFKGNYDNNAIVTNIFETAIEARYVRIIPKSWKNDISLRFDLLGCSEFKTTTLPTTTITVQKCDEPMGLESGLLSNQQIKASSYYDEMQSPHKGRLHAENNWSPQISDNHQYLEIDFMEPRVISGVATQGRASAPQWVTSYQVSYSNDDFTWTTVTDDYGKPKVFAGNFDGTTVVTNYLDQPTRMRYLRLIPQTWHNWIAIRMEIKGCYEPYPTPTELFTPTAISTEVQEITTQEVQVECTEYMNEKLQEEQIEVSSSTAGVRSGVKRLALNTLEDEDTGGWVAGQSNIKQFVLIDYGVPMNLTGIVTQGRNKHPEWVTDYKVLYSNDKINWHTAHDELGNSVFPGNEDRDTPVQHFFTPAITARYLKVVPTKWKDWISMRLEILGCPSTKGTPSELFHSTVATTTIPKITIPELPPECTDYMNKDLLENQIEVSSSLAGSQSGAKRLALNTLEEQDTGGWVAGQSNSKQFVLINYGRPLNLTGIVTQGRNKHPEWVTAYKVLYSNDKQNWLMASDELKNTVFPGNEDSNTPVQHFFSTAITAQYLKIVPIKWKDWISMRLEILGCPSKEEISTTEKCYSYGPWLSLHMPIPGSSGDIEPIDEIISNSKLCLSPAKIECREIISGTPFDKVHQVVNCDLYQGLACLNDQQTQGHKCYNYEVRIACWTCEVTTELPGTTPPPVALCPEIPAEMASSCPDSCPHGLVCDGQHCVDPINCACIRDGKAFKPGERIETNDCEECTCGLKGHSYCVNKTCPICHYGLEGIPNEHCQCECKTCPQGEILCPTNQYCLAEHLWCDGIVDCPDDERDCRHITTLTVVTEVPTRCPPQPIPKCQSDEELVLQNPSDACPTYTCNAIPQKVTETPPTPPIPTATIQHFCEMSSNYFKTFDGLGYQYDICQHIVVQDKESKKFNITVVKSCQNVPTQCVRSLIITQDDQRMELSQDLEVTLNNIKYTDAQLTKVARRFTDLTAKIIGDSVIVNSPKYGFEVSWNSEGNARFGVTSNLVNKTQGLCGYFSLTQDDDKTTPDGKTVQTVTEFGDSWSVGPQENCTPLSCPAEVLAEAIAACHELRRAPFDSCNDIVDPSYHIQVCVASICECLTNTNQTDKDCRCKAYLPYVEACEMKNVAKIRYWRVKQSCLPNCPPGLVWHDCGSACERTCDNLHDYNIGNVTCNSDQCVSGCFCPVGLVRKGDHCVQAEKCQDCICKGYGDPHYFTYDGLYFPFQGNCTYVLSQDIVRPDEPHKFQVYATNEDCFEEPMTTCTVAIMILFKNHIAHFRVNESVTFDGVQLYPSDLPFHKYGIHIESIPGRSVTFSVPEVFLEVRYFELNYGFEVRIPSEVYYNKTEGLCGNCNFNSSDDMCCQNGTMTNNTDEFGFSWVAVPPEGFESVNEICKLKEDTGCKPTIEEEKCDRILAEEFTPCHALVDPEMYLASCRFDTCRSINPTASICRAVMEYARKCAEFGVCIQNWRSDDFCPYECPPGMYFDQCGPKCPKSCKDITPNGWATEQLVEPQSREGKDIIPDWRVWSQKQTLLELDDLCDSTPVDGCFCTGGKVLKDGECVDPILCEICDDKGHKVGESWRSNPCTSCTCTMSLTVKCTTTECPLMPTCTTEETLKVTVRDNMTCCDKYDCVPIIIQPTCEDAHMPECKSGEIVKIDRNTPDGCPKYVCECDVTLCPPLQVPSQLEIGEETVIIKTGCCPIMETVCKPESCPAKPICSKDHEMKERPNPKSRCCAEYYCEPPPNVCMYTYQYSVVDGQEIKLKTDAFVTKAHKSGDAWMDGLCRKCTCETGHGQYRHRCTVEICPQLEDYQDNVDYNWKKEPQPNLCCAKFVRTGCVVNGKSYTIGEQWASPDGDKCKSYRCSILPSGEAIRVERQTKCIEECDLGAAYVKPAASSPDCCGKCEPNACVEDGKLYQVGDTWNSTLQKCFSAECLKKEGAIQMRFIGKACPPIPVGCTKKIKDSEGCCDMCNSTTESESQLSGECKPERIKPKETIGMFNLYENHAKCTNKKPILNMKACIGSCKSSSTYSADQQGFTSSCDCCTPTKMEKRTLLLECTDGRKRPIEYSQPTECACNGNCGSGEDQSEKQLGKLKATIY